MPRLRSVVVVALLWVAALAGSSAPDGFGTPRHVEMPLVGWDGRLDQCRRRATRGVRDGQALDPDAGPDGESAGSRRRSAARDAGRVGAQALGEIDRHDREEDHDQGATTLTIGRWFGWRRWLKIQIGSVSCVPAVNVVTMISSNDRAKASRPPASRAVRIDRERHVAGTSAMRPRRGPSTPPRSTATTAAAGR